MLEEYTHPQELKALGNCHIDVLRELTRVMCIALGGTFHLVQSPDEEDHAFDVYLCAEDDTIAHVELWRGSRGCYGMVDHAKPESLRTEADLARLLRRAKGMEPGPHSPPRSSPPPVLVDYAGLASQAEVWRIPVH
ncbi:MAG: hypothetical protein E6R03_14095 [Hyphomicrobiaceae bacterium]|nr:MAG: hypothetical protein E6R03_14095 [Hyphomicrobiaceae bacterium]